MTPSFSHAVVALDLSEASDIIVDCLPHFKTFGTTKFTLVTVKSIPYTAERTEINTEEHRKKLKKYKKSLKENGFKVDVDLRVGTHFYPPVEILTAAEENNADFVIIGNRGQSKVQELLLGSTATELLQRSALPVYLLNLELVIPDNDPENRKLVLPQSCSTALDHVLHPTDFSETANRAFEVIKYFDSQGKIKNISFIHVQGDNAIALKDPVSLEELNRNNRTLLNNIRNQLSDRTRNNSEIFITFGTPAKEIINTIQDHGITMIIMGSQGKGFVREFFLGSVSSQVTRNSKIPVLLIPARRED
ncbi:MAG: universal stress protein [Balneolaceae bacterium]